MLSLIAALQGRAVSGTLGDMTTEVPLVTNWIEVLAILLGPIFAVAVTIWLQRKLAKRDARLSVLSTLVSLRHAVVTADSVKALNLIDLVFHDVSSVRKLWDEYFQMLSNAGLHNPVGWIQRNQKHVELITEMAKHLGLGKKITALDVQRIYSPVRLGEFDQRQLDIQQELLRVLKSSGALEFRPK